MTISSDIQKLNLDAIVEFFDVDLTKVGLGILHFHPGINEKGGNVVWGGVEYSPFPIEATGFEVSGSGTLPRPKIKIANIDGLISTALASGTDLVGCKVTRRRTFAKYLDAVNFTAGNPSADSSVEFPKEIYFIDRKASENHILVEFELAAAFDVTGVQLPRRQIIQNSCAWTYRGPECGYTGGACADIFDDPTNILENDVCGKRLRSCELRFGEGNQLPFGGFPAAGLLR